MYTQSEDFKSIWALAHDWAGLSLSKGGGKQLPQNVKLNIQRLVSAILNRSLKAQTMRAGIFVDDSLMTLLLFDFKHFLKLLRCKWGKGFDERYLESVFIKRSYFINWCVEEKYPAPDFWVLTQVSANYKVSNRPKNELEDKAVCRALASAYWDIDPEIHPARMADALVMRKYGNSKNYHLETIKEWIGELDPLIKERKSGRPKDMVYKIDLERGVLQDKET